MKTIVVDDEPLMLQSFLNSSEGIAELEITGSFTSAQKALAFAAENTVDLAVLDVVMPKMTGLELAKRLRGLRPGIMIVFITAYDNFIREANEIEADYYIVKPYRRENLEKMAQRMILLSRRLRSRIEIRMLGRFTVLCDGRPVPLTGKAKEILALIVTRRGSEISNEEIYSTIWETEEYDNVKMNAYYNALRRLRDALEGAGIADLLVSTRHGQYVDTELFDCDWYDWLDRTAVTDERFDGEFLTEYSWAEPIIAEMVFGSK